MKKALTTTTLLLSLGLNTAFAGTMGEETYNMDGFYIGAGAGLATILLKNTASESFNNLNMSVNRKVNDSDAGILFEGQVGYGKMFKEKVYLGVKGSVYYTPINYNTSISEAIVGTALATVSNTTQVRFDPLYNIDGVLGFEVFPHFLPFVEAGVSFAGINSTDVQHNSLIALPSPAQIFQTALKTSGYKTEYNVGLGTAYQMAQHWLLSGELVYNYLGKTSANKTVNLTSEFGTHTSKYTRKYNQVSLFANISYLIPGS